MTRIKPGLLTGGWCTAWLQAPPSPTHGSHPYCQPSHHCQKRTHEQETGQKSGIVGEVIVNSRAKHFQKYKLNRQKWAFVAYFPFHLTAHCNPGQSEVLDESPPLATQARQYTSQSKAKWKTDKFRQKDRIKSSKPFYSSDLFKGEGDSEYTSMKIVTPLFLDK